MAAVETTKRLRRHREDLRRLGVERIGLFGSFQRDIPDSKSDVDLLIEFAPGEKSFDNFMALSFLLEEELDRPVESVHVSGEDEGPGIPYGYQLKIFDKFVQVDSDQAPGGTG